MRAKRHLTRASIRRGDRGAVLVIVAVFSVVAVVFLAIVIGLGDLRQEKKTVTLSTDAAALASAALADTEDPDLTGALPLTAVTCDKIGIAPTAQNGEGYTNIQQVADSYLGRNGNSNRLQCVVVRSGFKQGYVLVSANEIVDYKFALANSPRSGVVDGVSVAAIQSDPGGGLRPVGICNVTSSLDTPPYSLPTLISEAGGGNPNITLNGGNGYLVRFPLEKLKDSNQGCGNPDGNFGQLDLNGGSNPGTCNNPDGFCYQFENGYYGQVVNPVDGDPGNNYNSSTNAMNNLIASGQKFWVPVYGTASGGGGTAEFTVTHFMEVQFDSYCIDNNPNGCVYAHTDGEKYRWFRWRVFRFVAYSLQGPPQSADAAIAPPRLCAMSSSAAEIASNCLGPPPIVVPPPVIVPPPPPPTPSCSASTSPSTQTVRTTSNGPGNNVSTIQNVTVTVTVSAPANCGTITVFATIGASSVSLNGSGPAASSMQFVLPSGTSLPNGSRNNTTFTMTTQNNGSSVGNQTSFTTQYP